MKLATSRVILPLSRGLRRPSSRAVARHNAIIQPNMEDSTFHIDYDDSEHSEFGRINNSSKQTSHAMSSKSDCTYWFTKEREESAKLILEVALASTETIEAKESEEDEDRAPEKCSEVIHQRIASSL
ncbi:hypothetical protein EVAR_74319_1 [Eumeta japonica]|uniref:Uncharacterized protein n=1 Tax=Eumeta variegata TaxID=151549 RepID=A0A4C1SFT4_EUMVA|nr:hypothetical protein EVAR_74319_1 [Eumeta japonica]